MNKELIKDKVLEIKKLNVILRNVSESVDILKEGELELFKVYHSRIITLLEDSWGFKVENGIIIYENYEKPSKEALWEFEQSNQIYEKIGKSKEHRKEQEQIRETTRIKIKHCIEELCLMVLNEENK